MHDLVVYELPGGEENVLVEQHLYPLAEAGPVAFTPSNRAYGGIDGTWIRAGADVRGVLTGLGVPVPSDLAAAASNEEANEEANGLANDNASDGLGLLAVVGLACGGALGVGGATAIAVRRHHGPARSRLVRDEGQTRVTAATEQV